MKHNEEALKHSMRTGMNLMLHSPAAKMVATGVVTSVVISTTKNTSKNIMSLLAKHPVINFSLGLAAGYFIHKYRKEIIEAASGVTEKGKEFALPQRENLTSALPDAEPQ